MYDSHQFNAELIVLGELIKKFKLPFTLKHACMILSYMYFDGLWSPKWGALHRMCYRERHKVELRGGYDRALDWLERNQDLLKTDEQKQEFQRMTDEYNLG